MRRLIPGLLLALAGLAYPFVVYYGTEHVSPPIFALVLGAIWLIRAPSLLRKPGGRWMIAAALIYCVLLVFTSETLLLRWYPVLINALLLTTFGVSLIYGPPFVERFARMRNPDLPPEAVRYTRIVTWIWVAFFAFNGGMSAALSLWAPLAWWTLYNGLISYALMGLLFAVEWLVRGRMRRRIAWASADKVAQCLRGHPWLAQVHACPAGALLLLSQAGQDELRRAGRQALLDQLRQQLVAQALDPPQEWRLLDAAPGPLDRDAITQRVQTARPDRLTPQAEREQDGSWILTLPLPFDLIQFDDHFQHTPVLPGVLQAGWALALAAPRLGTSPRCREMEALKFQRLLRPGDRLELSLRFEPDADHAAPAQSHATVPGKLHFAYRLDGAHCSSGRLRVARTHA